MGEGICISTEGKGCVDSTEEPRALSPPSVSASGSQMSWKQL